jgi:hypothetical protein
MVSSQQSGFRRAFTFRTLPFAPSFLIAMIVALNCPAQGLKKVASVGYLSSGSPFRPLSGPELVLQQEFRKLGYIEGQSIAFEYRYAANKHDRLPALADGWSD